MISLRAMREPGAAESARFPPPQPRKLNSPAERLGFFILVWIEYYGKSKKIL